MHSPSFKTPPFVVWRIESPPNGPSRYRLASHGVSGSVMLHAAWQWLVLSAVIIPNHSASACSGGIACVAFLLLFTVLAILCNVLILRIVNARLIQPVDTLLHLCPAHARRQYNNAFPKITIMHEPGVHGRNSTLRLQRKLTITLQTAAYFLASLPTFLSRGYESRTFGDRLKHKKPRLDSQCRVNRARLRALKLRREDSCLQAFSSFAVLSCFVEHRRRREPAAPIPPIQTAFIVAYFMPIIFGFVLCLVTFCLYALKDSHLSFYLQLSSDARFTNASTKFPFMICVFVWFIHGILYLIRTLDQDFKSLFYDYFKTQFFPKSMVRYAHAIMKDAPDLALVARERWLIEAITAGMVGLTALYAEFLHNLGP